MKNTVLILIAVLFCTISVNTFAKGNTIEGTSNTVFGKYTISQSEQSVVIDNVAYKTWKLTYSDSGKSYVVFNAPDKNGEFCFTVRNEKFEIQYAKEGTQFGIRLVDQEKRTMKKKDVMGQMNYDQFVSQLVITSTDKSEEEYLGLVACFLPLLFG